MSEVGGDACVCTSGGMHVAWEERVWFGLRVGWVLSSVPLLIEVVEHHAPQLLGGGMLK